MQFSGGYRYPPTTIVIVLSVISLLAGGSVWVLKSLALSKGISLLLSIEGTDS